MENLDPKVVAAVIAAITSVITLILSLLLKSFWEKHFHMFKLEAEYKYEQRKRIKEILSKSKIQLLNSCESLNHRLWNFTQHYKDNWHNVRGEYGHSGNYYFNSFVYRLICVFSWIKKIEDEMVYLDTTIALKEGMEFIKYLRLFPQLFYDLRLYQGFEYDENYETDHFFRNNLERMAQSLIQDNQDNNVCTFSQFQENLTKYVEDLHSVCSFIDNICPDEDRLRWDRLQVFHIALIAFLNSFGYDFQATSSDKLKSLISEPRKSRLITNFVELLQRNKLTKQKEFRNIIKVISE